MRGGITDMALKGQKNEALYEPKEPVKKPGLNKNVRSRLLASESYDKNNVDVVKLRVPKGWKDRMKAYVSESDQYRSVNDMICTLIRRELDLKD